MVERGLHEPVEWNAPAAFGLEVLKKGRDHGFVSDSSFFTSSCHASL